MRRLNPSRRGLSGISYEISGRSPAPICRAIQMRLLFRLWPGESRPRLLSPLPGVRAATVSLDPVFRHSGPVRYVDPADPAVAADLAADPPAILAGSYRALTNVADRVGLDGSGPTHALVVLTEEGAECLTEAQRDELWGRYRVPIFEQVITSDGRLLAWECEAHEGLHLADCAEPPTRARLESGRCDCGASTPRVIGLQAAPRWRGSSKNAPIVRPAGLRSCSASRAGAR